MLVTLFNSAELKERYDISFSYRFSERYAQGLQQRVTPDFPVYTLAYPDIYDFRLLPPQWPLLLRRLWFFGVRLVGTIPLLLYEICSFWRLMRQLKPAIVHINNGGYPGALSARAAAIGSKLAGVPAVVMVVNSRTAGYTTLFRWLDYPVDRLVAHSVNQFVTGSTAASVRLREVLGLPKRQSVAIHNGIRGGQAAPPTKELRRELGLETFDGVIFGSVGNLTPEKGHSVLLDAVIQLVGSREGVMPQFKVVLVGEGAMRPILEDRIRENDMAEHFLLVGERSDVMDFMNLFDALVFPSTMLEDFPFVILEAMSVGKPVISSRIAGTVEQIADGETGILIEPGDTAKLAHAMRQVASSVELRREMGEAALQRFRKRFTSEVAAGSYATLYTSLIS